MTEPGATTPSGGGLLAAVGLFSVLPVPSRFRHPGSRAVRWLPIVGVLLATLAFIPAAVVWRGSGRELLAAALLVSSLALLTRGLHLDGVADLADGLGSSRPAAEARAIMKQSDIGPFGVIAVACVLLLQVSALAAVLSAATLPTGYVLVVAVVATGRVAAVNAAPARPAPGSGLGALVAGSVSRGAALLISCGLVVVAVVARLAVGGSVGQALWTAASVVSALAVAAVVCRHAVRRLGGVSGDVFGALIEIATTVALVVLAAER